MERLNLQEFDFMGLFTMRNIQGIEDLVTEAEKDLYLSRNYNDYYTKMTYSEYSKRREALKARLTGYLEM